MGRIISGCHTPKCVPHRCPCPSSQRKMCIWCFSDGRRLIDGLASWWTACHGYNHPHIVQRIAAQLEVMPHVMLGGIHHEGAVTLASPTGSARCREIYRTCFFSDSGSVAVEVAMKMAAQMWRNHGESNRNRFVTFRHAYHGDTTGAMSLCDPDRSMHAHFKGFLLEQYSQPIPETASEQEAFSSFLRTRRDQLAAVVIEPLVQGAGGMRFHSACRTGCRGPYHERAGSAVDRRRNCDRFWSHRFDVCL